MPRNVDSEVLDPKVAAELAELEAALAGTPSASSDLVALVADVRTDAPPPRAEFRAELDAQVARDFRPEGGPGAWLAALLAKAAPRRSMLLPAMGLATTMIVGLVVVVAAIRDPGDRMATSFSTQPVAGAVQQLDTASGEQDAASDAAAAAPGILNSESAPAPPPSVQRESSAATPEFGRKVERTTDLSLSTSPKKLQDIADGVVRVTQGVGGVVESSNVARTDTGGSASFTLSIPTARLDDAIQKLSKLAHVSSINQGSTDITGSFVSAADKLSDARAERKALLKALGAAKTAERIATLRTRLRLNRSEIAKYNGQLNALRRRADNTTVNVTLAGDGSAAADTDDGWSFGGAADDALRVLEVIASIVLISAAILVPLGLLAALAVLATRAGTRRRREQALDV